VEELEKRERDLSIELADLEKTEITAEEFTRLKSKWSAIELILFSLT